MLWEGSGSGPRAVIVGAVFDGAGSVARESIVTAAPPCLPGVRAAGADGVAFATDAACLDFEAIPAGAAFFACAGSAAPFLTKTVIAFEDASSP